LDTAIIVSVIIGSVVAMVLVFARTVLGVGWTGKVVRKPQMALTLNNTPSQERMYLAGDAAAEREFLKQDENGQNSVQIKMDSNAQNKSIARSQIYVQFGRKSDLNELANKRVKTCDSIEIGHIVAIDRHSIKILDLTEQEYVIPTYFIREYDEENVIIDVSIRYLHRYETERKNPPTIASREGQVLAFDINSAPNVLEKKCDSMTVPHLRQSSNWDNLIHKRAKTSDFIDIGHIFMIDEEFITVLEGVKQEYVIPADHIVEFDENNVFLDIPKKSLSPYKVKRYL